jgi:hypothetical protein
MTSFSFAPATREQARARIGIQGPAGSGKTKTALRLAEGLAKGGTIGVVDTERGSALKYAPVPGRPDLGGHAFGHMPMDNHDPRNLIAAVRAAEEAGIAVLIVDSWSHFWNGRGGLLSIVEQAGSKSYGGSFGAWKEANPIEQDMLDAMLNFRGHLIVTMRTKNDYVIEGKTVTKVGTKTVQRDGAEYELDVVMDMVQGTASVTKTRYSGLENLQVHHPGEDIADVILEQLGQGIDPVAAIVEALTAEGLTYAGALELHARAQQRGLLNVPHPHPKTGERLPLGDLIREYGSALKPQPVPAPQQTAAGQQEDRRAQETQAETSQPERQGSIGHGQDQMPTSAPAAEPATAPQMRKMAVLFNQIGLKERTEALEYTAGVIGRTIASRNELTKAEAIRLIDHLEKQAAGEPAA